MALWISNSIKNYPNQRVVSIIYKGGQEDSVPRDSVINKVNILNKNNLKLRVADNTKYYMIGEYNVTSKVAN